MNPHPSITSVPRSFGRTAAAFLAVAFAALSRRAAAPAGHPTLYKTARVEGLNIAYREAGPANAPTLVLLHGFPTSSHMFRNLIPALSDRYHIFAPDYPDYGQSSAPSMTEFKWARTASFSRPKVPTRTAAI